MNGHWYIEMRKKGIEALIEYSRHIAIRTLSDASHCKPYPISQWYRRILFNTNRRKNE